jgi:argininosuccinate synthase
LDSTRIVLAYNGSAASCAAVKWLQDVHQADVAALIVDIGQAGDVEEVRARALAGGALRAHVVDRSDAFAHDAVAAVMAQDTPIDEEVLTHIADRIIAAALVEVGRIEAADAVAHASTQSSFTEAVHVVDATLRVVAPAREWLERGIDLSEYVAQHRLQPGVVSSERNLLLRRALPGASTTAHVTIGFDGGLPVSVNGVAMGLKDLIECVSVISGQYSASPAVGAPALTLLNTAYAVSGGRESATVELRPLTIAVVDERTPQRELVNRA